jgi:hypothetical protein
MKRSWDTHPFPPITFHTRSFKVEVPVWTRKMFVAIQLSIGILMAGSERRVILLHSHEARSIDICQYELEEGHKKGQYGLSGNFYHHKR